MSSATIPAMSRYVVTRSATIDAPAATVHALVNSFREWRKWSPWEDLDPDLERTYTGPPAGPGARYVWKGNRQAGQGSMEITASEPERIDLILTFAMPFKEENAVTFDLAPSGDGTEVTWTMRGRLGGVMGLIGRFLPMDKWVGPDFEKGLARLKAAAEG